MSTSTAPLPWSTRVADAAQALRDWPWYETLRTLRQRFREDHLGLTAGSLTFTTLIALVPLFTVMLAIFTAFPMFASFQGGLEKYFLQSLVPDEIARPVLRALTQFASKARSVGGVGVVVLGVTALATMLTIDRTLNSIWRVRRPRPIAQRVLIYWAALTLGPLIIGISFTLTSYALSASKGFVGALPGGVSLLLDTLEFVLLALGMAGLFHHVPNTWVRWRHALAGGLFVAVAFETAKGALAWYLKAVPNFSAVYGTFATLPILMLWIYLGWVIVLLGAVIAAYAPSLQMRVARRGATPGHRFELALAVLQELVGGACRCAPWPHVGRPGGRLAHRPAAGRAHAGAADDPGLGGAAGRRRCRPPRAAGRRRHHAGPAAAERAAVGPGAGQWRLPPACRAGHADAAGPAALTPPFSPACPAGASAPCGNRPPRSRPAPRARCPTGRSGGGTPRACARC